MNNKNNLNQTEPDQEINKKSQVVVKKTSGGENNNSSPFFRSAGDFILEIIKVAVIGLVVVFLVRYYLFQPFYVKGASMEPNFYDYEYLIVNEISYRFLPPQRGEIVIFHYPKDPSQFFIKRIIGLPDEKIEIISGRVKVYNKDFPQGVYLNEDYLEAGAYTQGNTELTLGADEYFVMGDNRGSSFDSRRFGPVKKSLIIGKTFLRAWPFSKFKYFKVPDYNLNNNVN